MAAAVATRPAVAVVGLGKMGLPIAERILEGGFPLSVYNRTAEKADVLAVRGATVLTSPADALAAAEICVTMLADDEALEDVAAGEQGILAGAQPGTTLVDMSTVSVGASRRDAERAAAAEVDYVRAPVSGNPSVVRAGNLTVIVSGPENAVRAVEPLLQTIGPKVLYVGEDERARVVKLVLQILIAGTAELLAEGLVLGEVGGVERRTLLEVIGASAVASPFVGYKTEPLLRDDYSATFTTAMMLKDVDLVLDLAGDAELTLPLTRELRSLLDTLAGGGYRDKDFMALYLQLRETLNRETTATGGQVTT
jgi:3-hydroxyisobutyrate dehydrogenase-like beta-hydroxyacid dehydrogenase